MEMTIRTIAATLESGSSLRKSKLYRRMMRRLTRKRKRMVRYGLLAANLMVLAVVVGFVLTNQSSGQIIKQNAISTDSDNHVASPLDRLSSADIAVNVARMARLEESTAVVNNADTVNTQLAIAPADNKVIAKPQIVATSLKSWHDITKYITKPGDSVASVAEKFGVTSDTIKWSNGLTSNTLAPNKELWVLPNVNGIVYQVKVGDTPEALATRYHASKEQITLYNDAEVGGLAVGRRIIIPDGVQPAAAASSGSYNTTFWTSAQPVYAANGYDFGWCTWHAANRRRQVGNPLPSNLGNAISWYRAAAGMGIPTGTAPRAGAVLWHANIGGLGHVAYVESINDDGSLYVSDMNYPIWGRVTYRTVTPAEFGSYRFIY
jgi:surface antigen